MPGMNKYDEELFNQNRQKILNKLKNCEDGATFTDLLQSTNLSRTTLSKHLKILIKDGFVVKIYKKYYYAKNNLNTFVKYTVYNMTRDDWIPTASYLTDGLFYISPPYVVKTPKKYIEYINDIPGADPYTLFTVISYKILKKHPEDKFNILFRMFSYIFWLGYEGKASTPMEFVDKIAEEFDITSFKTVKIAGEIFRDAEVKIFHSENFDEFKKYNFTARHRTFHHAHRYIAFTRFLLKIWSLSSISKTDEDEMISYIRKNINLLDDFLNKLDEITFYITYVYDPEAEDMVLITLSQKNTENTG